MLFSDVWRLSVWRLSVAYIGHNSRTERPRKTEIGTEVAHVTHDSDATFRVKRSKVNTVSQSCDDISIRLDIIPALGDRQTDWQTDRRAEMLQISRSMCTACWRAIIIRIPKRHLILGLRQKLNNSIFSLGLVFTCYYCCILHSRFLKVFDRHLIKGLLTVCLLTYLKQCIHVVIHSVLITVVGFVVGVW